MVLITGIVLYSCKKDDPVLPDTGLNYYPQDVGRYVIYDADSIVYDDFENDTDVYRFRLKEKVHSVFLDNEGRPSLRIERYIKNYNDSVSYDSMSWVLKDVWYATVTSTRAERIEENQRFIKMIFPVRPDKTWNGNAFNTIGAWDYEYSEIDVPWSANGLTFDSTAEVIQKNDQNLIEKKFYRERYARNVGLVHKEVVDIYDTTLNLFVPLENRIKGGVKYSLTARQYGYE